ncbi:MAG: STAS domain-containing protein [Phycisphaerales bacterium]|jgi:hypothetical protein|nr:STAS domain-containing protein [Phycisphaerales bacterium]
MPLQWSENILMADLTDEPALSDELNEVIQQVRDHAGPPGEEHDAPARASGSHAGAPHVVLNFSDVSYINSSNIAQLLRLKKLLAEARRSLKLCALSDDVWSVMLVTGLDKVFRFAPDPMTALAGLQLEEAGGDLPGA